MIALPSDMPSRALFARFAGCLVAGVALVAAAGYALGGANGIRERWLDRAKARGDLQYVVIMRNGVPVSGYAWKRDLPKFKKAIAAYGAYWLSHPEVPAGAQWPTEAQPLDPRAADRSPSPAPRQAPAAPLDPLADQPAQPSTAPTRRQPAIPLR